MVYFKIFFSVFFPLLLFTWQISIKLAEKPLTSHIQKFVADHFFFLLRIRHRIRIVMKRFYNGMRKYDSFRKFFTLMLLLILIAIQFTDQAASHTVLRMIQESNGINQNVIAATHALLISHPYAIALAAIIGILFFFYRMADRILTTLHNSNFLYAVTALLTIIIAFYPQGFFIISQTLFIILIGAYIYPNRVPTIHPNGGIHVPDEQQQRLCKVA